MAGQRRATVANSSWRVPTTANASGRALRRMNGEIMYEYEIGEVVGVCVLGWNAQQRGFKPQMSASFFDSGQYGDFLLFFLPPLK